MNTTYTCRTIAWRLVSDVTYTDLQSRDVRSAFGPDPVVSYQCYGPVTSEHTLSISLWETKPRPMSFTCTHL